MIKKVKSAGGRVVFVWTSAEGWVRRARATSQKWENSHYLRALAGAVSNWVNPFDVSPAVEAGHWPPTVYLEHGPKQVGKIVLASWPSGERIAASSNDWNKNPPRRVASRPVVFFSLVPCGTLLPRINRRYICLISYSHAVFKFSLHVSRSWTLILRNIKSVLSIVCRWKHCSYHLAIYLRNGEWSVTSNKTI